MLGTLRMWAIEGVNLDGTAAFILAMTLVLVGHTIFFNVEAPFLKAPSVRDAFLQNFTWGVILTRVALAPIIWAALNYLARGGGLWFSMLIVSLMGRVIEIFTFGLRFNQWPATRDWVGIALVVMAVLVVLKRPGG